MMEDTMTRLPNNPTALQLITHLARLRKLEAPKCILASYQIALWNVRNGCKPWSTRKVALALRDRYCLAGRAHA